MKSNHYRLSWSKQVPSSSRNCVVQPGKSVNSSFAVSYRHLSGVVLGRLVPRRGNGAADGALSTVRYYVAAKSAGRASTANAESAGVLVIVCEAQIVARASSILKYIALRIMANDFTSLGI